jgi:ubiquinone/menaquinone biosynthesis C-methylase UbiE
MLLESFTVSITELICNALNMASMRQVYCDSLRSLVSDQANNNSAATLENAAIEGVTERIEVKTADMRQLPFPDSSFDVIVSSWAVHNLEAESDRHQALDEIMRVLKPNGSVVLADIVNQAEYAEYFDRQGMAKVLLYNNPIRDAVLKAVSFGSFAPSAVSASKSLQVMACLNARFNLTNLAIADIQSGES